jgi:hypothetical protein
MTDATLDKAQEANAKSNAISEEDKEKVVTYIANDFLSRSTLVDALSGIPLNTLIQIVQNQSVTRAKESVENLNDQDLQSLLDIANKQPTEKNEGAK